MRASFRLKLTLLAVAVAIVPLIAIGYIVSDVNHQALTDSNRQLLDAVVGNLANTADSTIAEADMSLIAIASALDRQPDERAAVVEAALDVATVIHEVAIYDHEGVEITKVENNRPLQVPALPARVAPESPGVARFGSVEFAGGEAVVLRALTTRDGKRTVAAYVALRTLAKRTIDIALVHLPAGDVAVLGPDGRAIADSRGERVGRPLDDGDFGVLRGIELTALTTRNIYVAADAERSDGTRVVGVLHRIDGTPFTIVVELPYRVVYHSIASVRRLVAVAVAGAIAIAVLAGVLLARRMTRPIRALVDYAGELAKRRFDRKVAVRATDELGVLGSALESAASELAASDQAIRKELAIRSDLGRYLPTELVDDIVARKRSLALGGERREVTVLFADVVGFTPLAEREAAETVVTILNELFTILTEIVFRHGGTVDKFIGDCVMAVWGASADQPDHAARAIAAARDMQRWLEVGNEMWQDRFKLSIELAIGVHTGDAVVGNFGSESRMAFTAIGDVVNVAARLESIARPNQILSTIITRRKLADDPDWISLGVRPIIGKAQPIELFEVR